MKKRILLILLGYIYYQTNSSSTINSNEIKKEIENDTIDIFFEKYKENAQKYLNRPIFKGTPLTGELLSKYAKDVYKSTYILIPVEFALAQCQIESGMGRYGKSFKTNPYNIGEFDNGTKIVFETTEQGVKAYFNLLAKRYLSNIGLKKQKRIIFKSVDELLENFVDVNGYRYASDKNYEKKLKKQIKFIKKWLNKHN